MREMGNALNISLPIPGCQRLDTPETTGLDKRGALSANEESGQYARLRSSCINDAMRSLSKAILFFDLFPNLSCIIYVTFAFSLLFW